MKKSIHDDSYRAVTDWLKRERKAAGITMRDLSPKLEVPHTWVAKVESGERRLDLLEFVRVCRAINVNPVTGLRHMLAKLDETEPKTK